MLEKERLVGGLARTENYKGFHFDMGGHRFFTKSEEVKKMWHEVLGDEFLRRPRLSRIYYDGKFFDYPLKPLNALVGLGLWQSVLIVLSYLRWQLFPYRREDTFEQWVTNRFGRRLFRDLLQDLHGEGLGHLLLGAEGGVGGPADQGPVAGDGRAEHVRQAEGGRSRP